MTVKVTFRTAVSLNERHYASAHLWADGRWFWLAALRGFIRAYREFRYVTSRPVAQVTIYAEPS